MQKPKPGVRVKPGGDWQKNRPLDTQAGEPGSSDPALAYNQDDLRMPHERDESPKDGADKLNSSTPVARQVIEQAASDIARGLRDTERRGVPSDVPSPGPAPENTPGGEVPESGIDRKATKSRAEQFRAEKEEKNGGKA